MTIEQLKTMYKSAYEFSKETGMSHVSYLNWMKWGFIPLRSQLKIEKATGGLLKASFEDVP